MEIWEEIAANRQAGTERLVAEYGDRLFTAACRIVQNEADAEDLVFRTFEQVVAKIGQFGSRSRFFSWMYSVMLNFRRMDLRRKGANALVFEGELASRDGGYGSRSKGSACRQGRRGGGPLRRRSPCGAVAHRSHAEVL